MAGFNVLSGIKWRTQIMLDIDVPNTWTGFLGAGYLAQVAPSIFIGGGLTLDVNYCSVDFKGSSDYGSKSSWSAAGFGVQLEGLLLYFFGKDIGIYFAPLIDMWDVHGDIARCDDNEYGCYSGDDSTGLGAEDTYSLTELAVETGLAFRGEGVLWEVNLLHIGYSPDAGATGPFYLGLLVRATF